MQSDDCVVEPLREEVKEPAKRWRNKYKALRKVYGTLTNCLRNPGEVWLGARIFPSADLAETAARNDPKNAAFKANAPCLYLGPIPVDENGDPL